MERQIVVSRQNIRQMGEIIRHCVTRHFVDGRGYLCQRKGWARGPSGCSWMDDPVIKSYSIAYTVRSEYCSESCVCTVYSRLARRERNTTTGKTLGGGKAGP